MRMTIDFPVALGDELRDRITGYEGVAVAITAWKNGCQRVTIQGRTLKDGKPVDSETFDVEDVELVKAAPELQKVAAGGPPVRGSDPRR